MEMRCTVLATGMVGMGLRLAMSTTLTVPAWALEGYGRRPSLLGRDMCGLGWRVVGGEMEEGGRGEVGLVRAEGVGEVHGGSELALLEIDDVDRCAVGAGPADAGIAVDRNVGEARVRGDGDFVAVDADGDFGEFAARFGIDEEDGVFFLVGDDEDAGGGRGGMARAVYQRGEQSRRSDERSGTQGHAAPRYTLAVGILCTERSNSAPAAPLRSASFQQQL